MSWLKKIHMKTNVEPNWNNKSFHLEFGESFLSIFFCLSQKVWCFFHQNRWCFTVWKLHIPLARSDSTHAMGSFRELLQKLEDAHDQELSQLREVSCLCFFVVFVFIFCCCLCCYLWFCCFFLFLGRFFVGTLVFFFPLSLMFCVSLRGIIGSFSTPFSGVCPKTPEELRHTRWASRKQTMTINPADLFDDSMKEVPGKDSLFFWFI